MSKNIRQEYSTHLLRHMRQTIGQNIHHYRYKRHIPLQKLAKQTGIPEILLDHYELGKSEIRLDELLKIAFYLKVDLRDLM